ncbi:MAG: hypothetical protein IJK12_07835 [Clostridia bacterium]|nr:hypothetical protein [Clostridia bacterium]
MSKVITAETFKEWMLINKPSILLLQSYHHSKEKIACKCKICGNVWSATPNCLKRGTGCPRCAKQNSAAAKLNKGRNTFYSRIKERADITLLEEYTGSKKPISVKCTNCGYVWNPSAKNLQNGTGCPRCAQKLSPTNGEFMKWMSENKPSILPLEQYTKSSTKILCRCLICGNEWKTKPNSLKMGIGCPNCAHTQTSFVEQYIRAALEKVIGKNSVISRSKSIIGKEIDIVVKKFNFGVEYGSWHWHSHSVENDKLKLKIAKARGLDLLVIYDGYDSETKPFQECLVYSFPLGAKEHRKDLNDLVEICLNRMQLSYCYSTEDYSEIERIAFQRSRKTTTLEFINEMNSINPSIEVLGEYKNSDTKVMVKCRKCGFVWCSTPQNLRQGFGCKKCSHVYSPTNEEFLEWIKANRPDITILEPYINLRTKLKCRCNQCGHIWSVSPDSIKAWKKCPKCAGNYSPTTEEFKSSIEEKRPDIRVLGEYVNTHTKILCECTICGNKWSPTPHDLKQGSGCPLCANMRKRKK